jgi:hypothetical protein
MSDVRKILQPEGGRVETGPTQFGDDWPGVFIRGDNALWYAHLLKSALADSAAYRKSITGEELDLNNMQLQGLLSDLESCRVN